MSVIIGIDPHKLLHAACAIDERETELARLEVRTNSAQVSDLLTWAAPFECRSWAIESPGGLGCLLAQQLALLVAFRTVVEHDDLGGQSGNDSHIQRGRQNPSTRHFGSSHSRTQRKRYARQRAAVTGPISTRPRRRQRSHLTQRGIARRCLSSIAVERITTAAEPAVGDACRVTVLDVDRLSVWDTGQSSWTRSSSVRFVRSVRASTASMRVPFRSGRCSGSGAVVLRSSTDRRHPADHGGTHRAARCTSSQIPPNCNRCATTVDSSSRHTMDPPTGWSPRDNPDRASQPRLGIRRGDRAK